MFCKNCGNQIADNEAFCNACGAAQRPAQQAQPQYQQYAQPQYAPQPNYGAKPNLLKSPFNAKNYTVCYVLSAVLSFMSLLFWFMPCIKIEASGFGANGSTRMSQMFDENVEFFGLHDVMFFFILAIIACLAGVVLALLPVYLKQVTKPTWYPLANAGIALYNFIWTIIIAAKGISKGWVKDQMGDHATKEAVKQYVEQMNDNLEKALTFGGWIFLLVSLAAIAVNLLIWAKQNKKF
ncbi:MAG: zinc ribbon domain-containing protein [Ruminococcaceae bacterium]|nr:zinc ribbon domain-containing protein [Oscillospiraceae bacterium]